MSDKQHPAFEPNQPAASSAGDSIPNRNKSADESRKITEVPADSSEDEKNSVWESVTKKVTDVGDAIGNRASQAGKAVVQTAANVGEAIGNKASGAGKAVANAGESAAKQTQKMFSQAAQGAGVTVAFVGNNPLLRYATQVLQVDWLVRIVDRVDVVKAQEAVQQLKQKHPNQSPSQIAHHLMLEKSFYAGGIGLVTSLVPGVAAATLGVDLMTTTLLQAEMVYQIAAAYGMDLQDPARKGEVLAIFGLALGGSRAIKAGLGLLRTLPAAGAAIGASANAVMLYSLGYAACRFYQAKQNPLTSKETLSATQAESEKYQEVALEQQAIMDGILAHLILAGNPGKSRQDIVPELQPLNLSPASLEVISANLQSPQPLEALLERLNRDFAVALLGQCDKIVKLDQITLPAEAEVIATITTKLNTKIDVIQ